nr:MAG TPA: hypothetical protein [Bacteriophage sp.]
MPKSDSLKSVHLSVKVGIALINSLRILTISLFV